MREELWKVTTPNGRVICQNVSYDAASLAASVMDGHAVLRPMDHKTLLQRWKEEFIESPVLHSLCMIYCAALIGASIYGNLL